MHVGSDTLITDCFFRTIYIRIKYLDNSYI